MGIRTKGGYRGTYQMEMDPSLGFVVGNAFDRALAENPVQSGLTSLKLNYLNEEVYTEYDRQSGEHRTAKRNIVPVDAARRKIEALGLNLSVNEDVTSDYLDELIRLKQVENKQRQAIARADGGIGSTAAILGAGLAASALDPLNIALSFVPVAGAARWSAAVARTGRLAAGAAAAGRTATTAGGRFGTGVLEGAVGAALVEPLVLTTQQQQQADYTMMDSLLNVAFGGVLGGGLHTLGGAIGDRIANRQARQLAEKVLKTAPRESILARLGNVEVSVRDQALATAARQMEDGQSPRVESVLQADGAYRAGAGSPETLTVFHGSSRQFERFSSSEIGTGEGAQNFGSGLYFSTDPKVAKRYSRSGQDAGEFLYEAEVRGTDKDMFDLEKPLSEQPEAVQEVLRRLGEKRTKEIFREDGRPVKGLEPEVVQELKEAGLLGFRYKDQGSRGLPDEKSAFNYVIIDDSRVEARSREDIISGQRATFRREAQQANSAENYIGADVEASAKASAMVAEKGGIEVTDVDAINELGDEAEELAREVAEQLGVAEQFDRAMEGVKTDVKTANSIEKGLQDFAACMKRS